MCAGWFTRQPAAVTFPLAVLQITHFIFAKHKAHRRREESPLQAGGGSAASLGLLEQGRLHGAESLGAGGRSRRPGSFAMIASLHTAFSLQVEMAGTRAGLGPRSMGWLLSNQNYQFNSLPLSFLPFFRFRL